MHKKYPHNGVTMDWYEQLLSKMKDRQIMLTQQILTGVISKYKREQLCHRRMELNNWIVHVETVLDSPSQQRITKECV